MDDKHVTRHRSRPLKYGTLTASIPVRHVTPVTSSDDPMRHVLNGFCWCQPLVEDVLPEGRIYIHRRSLDSPHIEVDV